MNNKGVITGLVDENDGKLVRQSRKPQGQPGPGLLSAFMPGQQAAIANQLNAGFGGGVNKWTRAVGAPYSDIAAQTDIIYGRNPTVKNDGKKNDGKTDDSHKDPLDIVGKPDPLDSWGHDRAIGALSMSQPLMPTTNMPAMNPPVPTGLQPYGQQPQMLGQQLQPMTPQFLALLRQRMMMGGQ